MPRSFERVIRVALNFGHPAENKAIGAAGSANLRTLRCLRSMSGKNYSQTLLCFAQMSGNIVRSAAL